MQLEFIPVEEFYFAITLSVRTLEEFGDAALVAEVRSRLAAKCGRPSTVAAGHQNTFNYVFRVPDYDNSPAQQLIVSISDHHDKLRLSSDYGWVLDESRKAVRSPKFHQRGDFTQELRHYLQTWLGVSLAVEAGS